MLNQFSLLLGFVTMLSLWMSQSISEQPTASYRSYLPLVKQPVNIIGRTGGVSRAFNVDSRYAYVGEGHELVVIDLQDTVLHEVASLHLPGVAQNIELAQSYAYIATGIGGLAVVDLRNPSHLSLVGQWSEPTNQQVLSVLVMNRRAYVNSADSLFVLDIADPTQIRVLGHYDLPEVKDGLRPKRFINIMPHPSDQNFLLIQVSGGLSVLFDLRDLNNIQPLFPSVSPYYGSYIPHHSHEGNLFYHLEQPFGPNTRADLIVNDLSVSISPKTYVIQHPDNNLDLRTIHTFVWNGRWIEFRANPDRAGGMILNIYTIDYNTPKLALLNRWSIAPCQGAYPATITQIQQYFLLHCGVGRSEIQVLDLSSPDQAHYDNQGVLPIALYSAPTSNVSMIEEVLNPDYLKVKHGRAVFYNGQDLAMIGLDALTGHFVTKAYFSARPEREFNANNLAVNDDKFVVQGQITATLIEAQDPFTITQIYSPTQIVTPSIDNNKDFLMVISPTLQLRIRVTDTQSGRLFELRRSDLPSGEPIGVFTVTNTGHIDHLRSNGAWLIVSYDYFSPSDITGNLSRKKIEFWNLGIPEHPTLDGIYEFEHLIGQYNNPWYDTASFFPVIPKPNLMLIARNSRYEFLDIHDPSQIRVLNQQPISYTQLSQPLAPKIIYQDQQYLYLTLDQRHVDIFDILASSSPKYLTQFDLGRDLPRAISKGPPPVIPPTFLINDQVLYVIYDRGSDKNGGSLRIWDLKQLNQPKELGIWETPGFEPRKLRFGDKNQRLYLYRTRYQELEPLGLEVGYTSRYYQVTWQIQWIDIHDLVHPIIFHAWDYTRVVCCSVYGDMFQPLLPEAITSDNIWVISLGEEGLIFLR